MDYRITNEQTDARADEIVQFLQGPRLYIPQASYSQHGQWLENKVHPQLKSGVKIASICLDRSDVSGVIIYQNHPELSGTAEIRNITVRPTDRGRYIGSFLLKNTEHEIKYYLQAEKILIDCKQSNIQMIRFLQKHGYTIETITDLYHHGDDLDVVFVKKI